MKERSKIVSLLVLTFLASILFVWLAKRDSSPRERRDPNIQSQSAPNIPLTTPQTSEGGVPPPNPFQAMMQTSIEFYGIVLDQDGIPIPSAKISASVLDSWKGSPISVTSANDGMFKILSTGTAIHIKVEKLGYHVVEKGGKLHPSTQGFDFGVEDSPRAYKPDPASPAIFNLRKSGNVLLEQLRAQSTIPRDGTPVSISLSKTGKFSMSISCRTLEDNTQPPNAPYDWRCEVSVEGGGVQEMSDGFDLIAPENGYESAFVIDMPKSMDEKEWNSRADKRLWFQFPDRTYARISFMMNARGDHFAVVEGHRNPTPNDRNLETKLNDR